MPIDGVISKCNQFWKKSKSSQTFSKDFVLRCFWSKIANQIAVKCLLYVVNVKRDCDKYGYILY